MHARIFKIPSMDLEIPPEPCAEFKPSPLNQVTIGDLHGNTLKFIHFLIFNHIMTMRTRSTYARFVKLYKKKPEEITQEDIAELKLILANSDINPHAVGLERNLGDKIADRGQDDYKTLKILEKMGQSKLPYEILFSNHDAAFLARRKKRHAPYLYEPFALGDGAHCNSLHTLGMLILKGIITEEEVEHIIEQYYKPYLKIISYSIDDTVVPPILTLYSHAPIGLETVEALSKKYSVPYNDKTIRALCNTIDEINCAFRQSDFVEDYKAEVAAAKSAGAYSDDAISLDYPLFRTAWTRGQNDKVLKVPSYQNGYRLHYVHGHEDTIGKNFDTEPELKSHRKTMTNLSTGLGKKETNEDKQVGTFYSLFSQDKSKPTNTTRNLNVRSQKVITKKYEIPVQELQPPKSRFFKRKNDDNENVDEVILDKTTRRKLKTSG